MGKLAVLGCVLAAAGCQPMYGKKAEPMTRLPVVRGPHPVDAELQVTYVEDCEVSFTGDPRRVHRDPAAAAAIVNATAAPAGPPTPVVLVSNVDQYSTALRKDPYNADATLELALAYDHVLRKGCAVAMLGRLADLAHNPALAPEAAARIADVDNNPHWFRGYRKAALAAAHR